MLRLLALVALLCGACRDDLCVRTLVATCDCDDPLQPNLDHCVASYDIVSCVPLDAAVTDPCRVAPCCRGPADASVPPRPADLSLESSDGL